jgi:opine dehydrogenase
MPPKIYCPAESMIQTSIGNVGMIFHCAPILLNSGWTESENSTYKFYIDGISPYIGRLIEKIDAERVLVWEAMGMKVETAREWLVRTY